MGRGGWDVASDWHAPPPHGEAERKGGRGELRKTSDDPRQRRTVGLVVTSRISHLTCDSERQSQTRSRSSNWLRRTVNTYILRKNKARRLASLSMKPGGNSELRELSTGAAIGRLVEQWTKERTKPRGNTRVLRRRSRRSVKAAGSASCPSFFCSLSVG